ncbi:flagellar hook-associated protein FlgK [soil metagenome]
MSVSTLMAIGKTAMFASYAQMNATGNNIANANTVGYSRQQADLAAAPGQQTSVGFYGAGVNVQTVTRSYDQFLTGQANVTASTSAAATARLDKLTQLESVFGTGASGIGFSAGALLNSFVDVANAPGDSSARQVALSQARQLSAMMKNAGDQITTLQSGLANDVKSSLASVNTMATQVAALNKQIADVKSSGNAPNDLLDQRDKLVSDIGKIISVSSVNASDGSVSLFVGGGQSLVLGAASNQLSAVADPYDATKVQVGLSTSGGPPVVVPADSIEGGSVAGLLRVQNQDLTAATNLLGQMATAFSSAVNQQQSLGLDLSGNTGSPIFSVASPRVLASRNNSGTGSIDLAVTDASKVQASDYKLAFDGSQYTLTRLSDNTTAAGSPYTPAQMAAGVNVDGIGFSLASGTVNPGDSFLLQPVAQAAQSMKTVLGAPAGLAAASPFTASLGASNKGTATIDSIGAVSTGYDKTLSASISFTSDTGNYNWSLSDGSSGTGVWSAGNPITLNGAALQLAGVPKTGDTMAMTPTTAVASNNGNAQAFVDLSSKAMVIGQTVTDAYAAAISDVGVRVQSAKTSAKNTAAAAAVAETSRGNSSGVNLDEEASRLIQYQQSYQAAAKVLQAAQAVFDTLLRTVAA